MTQLSNFRCMRYDFLPQFLIAKHEYWCCCCRSQLVSSCKIDGTCYMLCGQHTVIARIRIRFCLQRQSTSYLCFPFFSVFLFSSFSCNSETNNLIIEIEWIFTFSHTQFPQVCPSQEYQRKLHPDDLPLRAQQQRTQRGEQCHFIVRKNPHFIARQRRQSLLLSPIVETHKSTALATAAIVTGQSTKLMENEHLNDGNRYTDDNNNGTGLAVFHKNCVRELNYSRLTRVPTTDHLNECQPHDDDAIENSCTSNSFIKTATTSITNANTSTNIVATAPTVVTGITPIATAATTTTYCPVYSIREIRTACNSFSALSIDKKLWDLDCKPSSSLASMTAANRHSVAGVTTTTTASMNIVREAVNNNPAKGYGSYVYI